MISFAPWLNSHGYELIKPRNSNGLYEIEDVDNGAKNILKVTDVSKLDKGNVVDAVKKMNVLNKLHIVIIMKYRIIDICENNLYRISREYKVHLDIINPIKYFENIGVVEVLSRILLVLKVFSLYGLFHSDLKPSNVFLNEENEVIIGDYLNNLLYKGIEAKQKIKTNEDLCFVSIDELLGLELDISSDIWNFGLIFYYVLSGEYPFHGSNMDETMRNIENVNYTPLESEFGDDLNPFIRKILVKEKSKRMELDEVISELKSLINPEEIEDVI